MSFVGIGLISLHLYSSFICFYSKDWAIPWLTILFLKTVFLTNSKFSEVKFLWMPLWTSLQYNHCAHSGLPTASCLLCNSELITPIAVKGSVIQRCLLLSALRSSSHLSPWSSKSVSRDERDSTESKALLLVAQALSGMNHEQRVWKC